MNPNQDWSNPLNTNVTCSTNKQTPFDSYWGSNTNTEHTTFTKEAIDWLNKELLGQKQAPYFPIQPNLINSNNNIVCNGVNKTFSISDECSVPSPVKYTDQAGLPVDGWSVQGNLSITTSTP